MTGFDGLRDAQLHSSARLEAGMIEESDHIGPLVGRLMGGATEWLLGTFHGVSRDQLQAYLDEFVFRHHRRGNPQAAFRTLLGLSTGGAPAPLSIVRGASDLAQFPIKPSPRERP